MAVKNGKVDNTDAIKEGATQTDTVPQGTVVQLGRHRDPEERKKAIGKFNSPEYSKPISRAPVTQVINTQDPSKVGLFIKEGALKLINWKGEKPTHVHAFGGGTSEELGILLQSPSMNVVQRSNTFIESREDDEETGAKSGTLLDMVYESDEGREFYNANKDTGKYVLRAFYFVFIVDENGENLHETPIAITLKGVALVKFGIALDNFRSDIEMAFANYEGTDRDTKSDAFHRLCIFKPTFVPSHEPKTEPNPKKRSWVAIISEYDTPSPDGSNFLNFFCEWKEGQYDKLVRTNPDLVMAINKAAPIVREHNRLVLEGKQNTKLLPPANIIDAEPINDEPAY